MSFICKVCNTNIELDHCLQVNTTCRFTQKALNRYKCTNCGVIFGSLEMINMSKENLLIEHNNHYLTHEESASQEFEIKTFLSLNPNKNGIYLDWGFGRKSVVIDRLNNDGFNVYGFDLYSNIIGDKIITDIEKIKEIKFDGIFSNNLIEHLQNPIKELQFMNSILKPQAKMAHSTACYSYLYEYSLFHLYFYVDNSIEYLCKNTGFSIVEKIINGEDINIIYCKN